MAMHVYSPRHSPTCSRSVHDERGFTIIEFAIAMAITTAVLAGTAVLATQVQGAYNSQLDDVAVEQEVRYALDWMSRYIRSAGSDPYGCVAQALWTDPNGNGDPDDLRIVADVNPPDGDCTDSDEDVTIALDAVNRVITLDSGAGAVAMTDPVITGLAFTYLDADRNATANEEQVAYVGIAVTGESKGRSATTGFTDFTLATEVRLRVRR
jgi:Tfp pilus assembly protein PilW